MSQIVSPPKKYCNNNYYAVLADTAATYTYLDDAVTEYYGKPTPAFGPHVKVANINIMSPKAQTHVKLSPLPKEAKHGYILDNLATGS